MMQRIFQFMTKYARIRVLEPQYEKVLWKFNSERTLDEFICVTDGDVGGNSNGSLTLNHQNKALFSGNLSTKITPGTNLKYTGFCSIRSIVPKVNPSVG